MGSLAGFKRESKRGFLGGMGLLGVWAVMCVLGREGWVRGLDP